MNRRTFVRTTVAAAASSLLVGTAHAQTAPRAKNVVLVHGLFADGSSWSEVIPRLQAAGLNVTSVQNPLTRLPEAMSRAVPEIPLDTLSDVASAAITVLFVSCEIEMHFIKRSS
jgi:hypothetical protein